MKIFLRILTALLLIPPILHSAPTPAKKAPDVRLTVAQIQQKLPEKILVIDGKIIGKTEFMRHFLDQLPGRRIPKHLQLEQLPYLFRIHAETFADDYLLQQYLKEQGVKGTPEMVRKFYERQFQNLLPDEKALLIRRLKSSKLTPQKWIARQSRSPEVQKEVAQWEFFQRKFVPSTPVDEAIIRKYYNENTQRFLLPEQREISHIRQNYNRRRPKSREQTRQNMAKIAAQLQKNPADFGRLARTQSACSSRQAGGRLGAVSLLMLSRNLQEPVWKLSKGQISGVLDTNYGSMHIVRCDKIIPAQKLSYEAVKPWIIALKQQEIARTKILELLKNLHQKHQVKILLPQVPLDAKFMEIPADAEQ